MRVKIDNPDFIKYFKLIDENNDLTDATKANYQSFLRMLFNNFNLKKILESPNEVINFLEKKYSYLTYRNMLIATVAMFKHNQNLILNNKKTYEIYRDKMIGIQQEEY